MGPKEDETISMIDKLQPALTGKNPRQRLSLFFCIALLSLFCMGLLIGYDAGIAVEEKQSIITHIALFFASVLCAGIGVLASLRFIQTFQLLLSSLDSTKEPQQAERAAQSKALQDPQATKPRNHTHKNR